MWCEVFLGRVASAALLFWANAASRNGARSPCRSAPCARQPFAPVFNGCRPGADRTGSEARRTPEGRHQEASEASHPVSSVFGCRRIADEPPTRRAFRSPAGARVTFLLLAHARALGVRTAKPARRAEGVSPESKKSNPKKTALRAKARSDMRDRSVGGPRPAWVCSLLPRTKWLHRNAS